MYSRIKKGKKIIDLMEPSNKGGVTELFSTTIKEIEDIDTLGGDYFTYLSSEDSETICSNEEIITKGTNVGYEGLDSVSNMLLESNVILHSDGFEDFGEASTLKNRPFNYL